jgi:flagellar basal body rod protein FlgF
MYLKKLNKNRFFVKYKMFKKYLLFIVSVIVAQCVDDNGNCTVEDGNFTVGDNGNFTVGDGNFTVGDNGNCTFEDNGNFTVGDNGNCTVEDSGDFTVEDNGDFTVDDNGNFTVVKNVGSTNGINDGMIYGLLMLLL